jgi:hypothetical protein
MSADAAEENPELLTALRVVDFHVVGSFVRMRLGKHVGSASGRARRGRDGAKTQERRTGLGLSSQPMPSRDDILQSAGSRIRHRKQRLDRITSDKGDATRFD